MITSFTIASLENAGGLKKLEFIPSNFVAQYPQIIHGKLQGPIVLAVGVNWLVGYYSKRTSTANKTAEYTAAGVMSVVRLTGRIPISTVGIHQNFSRMQQTPMIVKYTDNNNKVWIIGTPQSPAYFNFSENSGVGFKDGSFYNYEFSCTNEFAAVML